METNTWYRQIKAAEKTSIVQDGKRKFHYKFHDGQEMAEEYSMETNVLLRRAWKKKNPIRGSGDWEVEIGDPEPQFGVLDDIGIKENSSTPYVTRRITKTSLEWRIRNLPYPVEVYSVTADTQDKCLVVRTTNKKYFKKLPIPELERVGILPLQENISLSHKYNTLIIVYKKPSQVLEMEQKIMEELKTVAAIKDDQCKTS
ncbi:protein DPCD [Macrosteles quadrilineatus]|uniref:protein DPCD n=1 Tax=Macrosteles quadrilineatus TaxID=74068 RepID=UPI0023E0BC0B|nr:protein DPCD [Macrosteles quadrilineatus]